MIGAVIGGAIGLGTGIHNVRSSNKALTKAFKEQTRAVMQNYNYNQMAMTREATALGDAAKQRLFQLSLNAIQNNSTVEAALAETGYEGRTAGKLMTSMAGQEERQKTAVKTAYYNDIAEIRSKKDALYIQTDRQIQQARDNLRHSYTTGLDALLKVGVSTAQGALMGSFAGSVGSAMGGTSSALGSAAAGAAGSGSSGTSFLEALNTVWEDSGKEYLGGMALLSSIGGTSRSPYGYNFY